MPPDPERSPRRSVVLHLALAAGGALAALLVVELALRLRAPDQPPGTLADAIRAAGPLAPGEVGRWVHLLRVDDDDRVAYGLRPDFEGEVEMGGVVVGVRTNSLGYRGPEWPRPKPPGTVRIVGLGDSVMMGFGVEESEAYLTQLADRLAERRPGVAFECVNLAVGGYNTVQQAAVLRAVGLELEPDLVLVGVVENDANAIIYARALADRWRLDRSFLAAALAGTGGEEVWLEYGGFGPLGQAARALATSCEAAGVEAVAFSYGSRPRTRRILDAFAGAGVATRDLGVELNAYRKANGIGPYRDSDLVLHADNLHPSAEHHALIAEWLADALVEEGFADRAIARAGG